MKLSQWITGHWYICSQFLLYIALSPTKTWLLLFKIPMLLSRIVAGYIWRMKYGVNIEIWGVCVRICLRNLWQNVYMMGKLVNSQEQNVLELANIDQYVEYRRKHIICMNSMINVHIFVTVSLANWQYLLVFNLYILLLHSKKSVRKINAAQKENTWSSWSANVFRKCDLGQMKSTGYRFCHLFHHALDLKTNKMDKCSYTKDD